MEKNNVLKYEFRPEKREAVRKTYAGFLKLLRLRRGKKNEIDYYFGSPVVDNTILISGLGRSVRGNMQYILNELNSNDLYKDYKIYVRTDATLTDSLVKDYIEKNNWTRTVTVPKGLTRYMETCKYLITESYFPYNWIKRPGQVMIDLWHGTPLKRLGVLKSGDKCHKTAIQQKNFLSADYLLYPNEFTKTIMWESYRITSLLSAKALMMGYPRTAGILKAAEGEATELRRILAPKGEKIYAYMPTFRGHLTDEEALDREKDILGFFDSKLADDQILYVNLHHHIKEGLNCDGYNHIKLFPPLLDSYSLLAVSDALISDYSSVFFDYLVLKKQIILYIEDIDSYLTHHGLNVDIESLPFDLARSKDEVIEMLNRGKKYDDTDFFSTMCSFDQADNPEKLCRLFLGDEEGLVTEEIPGNEKAKILLYTDGCKCGKDTQLLGEIAQNYDHEKAELYIGCDEYKTSDNMDGAYPMLHKTLVISSRDNCKAISSVGEPVLQLYKNGKISFGMAMKLLNFEYALVTKRMYGEIAFDVLGIFDTAEPSIVLGFALSEAKNKVMFISDSMEEALKKDGFLRDAVKYAARYCCSIIVSDQNKMATAKDILNKRDAEKLLVADTAETIRQHLYEISVA